ncbi:MAG: hypothetical protein E7233_10305 [Lachnospiraceae bacterium]|nr:hypothetical protein [Lachnospiraceae bacterium]
MGNVFLMDVDKCNGCYDCLMACNEKYFGESLSEFNMAHPSLGQFLMKIEEHLYGEPPRIKQFFLVKPCMHCTNAPCAQCCPVDAIKINEFGLVELLEDKCISCRLCVYACPYDLIFYDREQVSVVKCSGCSDLLRQGKEPACVSACERKAITFGDWSELGKIAENADQIIPEPDMKPLVFYRNLPKS